MLDDAYVKRCERMCEEFLLRAQEWRAAREGRSKRKDRISDVAEHASLVRISLDLWRALAEMRRRS